MLREAGRFEDPYLIEPYQDYGYGTSMLPAGIALEGEADPFRRIDIDPAVSVSANLYPLAKRAFDILFAATFLIVALPMLVLLSIALQIDSPGALLFVQQRVGKGGKMFGCIKFRTMHENAEEMLAEILDRCPQSRMEWERDHKLRIDCRISRFGKFMRKLSLDELPQLINILRGEMSVVGPRPIVAGEIPKYGRFFSDYTAVKPGLTGLWQVSGRNDVSYDERVQLDVRYRNQASLLFDLAIVLRTIPAVVGARGSY